MSLLLMQGPQVSGSGVAYLINNTRSYQHEGKSNRFGRRLRSGQFRFCADGFHPDQPTADVRFDPNEPAARLGFDPDQSAASVRFDPDQSAARLGFDPNEPAARLGFDPDQPTASVRFDPDQSAADVRFDPDKPAPSNLILRRSLECIVVK
jgi:hypothetical protein